MPHVVDANSPSAPPPAFPPGLREAPIQRIQLADLLHGEDTDSLWTACRTHGFFYLDCTTCPEGQSLVRMADELEALSHRAFALSTETKNEAAMSRHGRSLFGYKGPGIVAAHDPHRRRDVGEFWNLSKDDILGQSTSPVPYPDLLLSKSDDEKGVEEGENNNDGTQKQGGQPQDHEASARSLLSAYVRQAHAVGIMVMRLLAPRLGLDQDELASRHRLNRPSGDHVRLTFGPGDAAAEMNMTGRDEASTKITTFAHTDFGSVTLLFNWLGGLQIEQGEHWEWVRPIPGHAICNLGDAMVDFSGGRLSSGRHRVVAAPGEQAALDRYSVVYFVRPEDDVVLEDITPGAVRKPEHERWKAGRWIDEQSRKMGNSIPKNAEG